MVTPSSARPATSMPVMAPALKASSSPPASDVVAACAVRTLARTETFMPMKPAAPDSTAPISEADRDQHAEEVGQQREDHDADQADRRVLALADRPARPRAPRPRFPASADCRRPLSKPMPSPRWRKRWKALRRAQSPIMLSLNLPQILILTPRLSPRERRAHKKKACPAQKGGLKSAGPCQNHTPGATPRSAKMVDFGRYLIGDERLFAKILEMAVGQAL